MSALNQSDDDRLTPSAVDAADSGLANGMDPVNLDLSHGQPTTESMNNFLREVDSLFTSSAEDRPEPRRQSPRCDAREYAAATSAESVAQRVLTPPIPPTLPKTTTSTTGIRREGFHSPVSRIWVDVAIAAGALIVGLAIGHSTQKVDGSSAVSFRPQPSSAVVPVTADPQKSAPQSSLPLVPSKNLPVIISELNYKSTSDTTNVQISLQDGVNYEVHRISNPDRIYVDLWKAHVAPELLGKSVPVSQALVSRFRIAQRGPDTARITLETKGVCDYSARILPSPYRLVITLSEQAAKKG